MKLTEFVEESHITEEFLELDYDMWGWIDPKGQVHLPTRADAHSSHEEHHSTMIQKFGFDYGYKKPFQAGWIRWYLSGNRLMFNCDGHPSTVSTIKKAVRKIEAYAKDSKKFNYFNGSKAEKAASIPGGMLLINSYAVEIIQPKWMYLEDIKFTTLMNKVTAALEKEKIEQTLKETTSAGATGAGSIGAYGNGFANGGPGTLSRPGVNVTGVRTSKKRKRVAETHVPGHLDHEVRMAHGETLNLAQNSAELYQMLRDQGEQEGLPGWISSYITLANDYIESVVQYMREEQAEQATGEHHQF